MKKGSYTYPAISGVSLKDLTPETKKAFRHLISEIEDLHREMHDILVPETWNAPTLLNSWANAGGGYNDAGYLVDELGFVHLRGRIDSGSVGSAAFTLPSGYRPTNAEAFSVISNAAVGLVEVDSSGNVTPKTPSNNTYVSLDGITFLAS